MTYAHAILSRPTDLTEAQRATLARLVGEFGSPFAFSVASSSALPTWQNIGTVSINAAGIARKIHNSEEI